MRGNATETLRPPLTWLGFSFSLSLQVSAATVANEPVGFDWGKEEKRTAKRWRPLRMWGPLNSAASARHVDTGGRRGEAGAHGTRQPPPSEFGPSFRIYIMGDLLPMGDRLLPPLAYPEMVRVIFPETFNTMSSTAHVQVELKVGVNNGECKVYGKIAALISRHGSRVLRAGRLLFTRTQGADEPAAVYSNGTGVLEVPLARSAVAVPSGWSLRVEVDLQIETGNNSEAKSLKYTTRPISKSYETTWHPEVGDNQIKVKIMSWVPEVTNENIGRQLSSPLEVRMESGYPTVVYTIGDELSFTESIMALRRILADHDHPEDILDGHNLLNLSSTREHPLLPEQHSRTPPDSCWIQAPQGAENNLQSKKRSDGDGQDGASTKPKNQDYSRNNNKPQDNKTDDDSARRHMHNNYHRSRETQHNRRAHNQNSSDDVPQSKRHKKDNNAGTDGGEAADAEGGGGPARASQPREAAVVIHLANLGEPVMPAAAVVLLANPGGPVTRTLAEAIAVANPKKLTASRTTGDLGWSCWPCPCGTTIIVFDGKRGQNIYEEEQGQQNKEEMMDLVLSGPYTGISAYGCFAIKIEIPSVTSPIEWEWNCYDPKYAAQVDKPPVRRHPIGNVAEVTYAVMSNAREAAMQVMLRLKDGHHPSGVGGKITALINGFEVPSVLFDSTEATGKCICLLYHRRLVLARNVVAVPCGEVLHIEVDLNVQTSNNQEPKRLKANLDFHDKGIRTQPYTNDDGDEGKVEITWYPEVSIVEEIGKEEVTAAAGPSRTDVVSIEETGEQLEPDQQISVGIGEEESRQSKFEMSKKQSHGPRQTTGEEESTISSAHPQPSAPAEGNPLSGLVHPVHYIIGDVVSFYGFISILRDTLAKHPDRGDILDSHYDSDLSPTDEHPLLAKKSRDQQARWLPICLHAVGKEERSSVTLLVHDHNLYCIGFMNQNGVSFELSNPEGSKLPSDYNPVPLDWGITYESILNVGDKNKVKNTLDTMRLGKTFAADAVRVLSRYQGVESGSMIPRMALAGLIVMVCESARMNPLFDAIAGGWNTGTRFTKQLMEYMMSWELISIALLEWKDGNYERWIIDQKLAKITGVKSPVDALDVIHLVRNFTTDERQLLSECIYGR
ncbi:hypothetical protein C2845_PM17G02470 [Panicum miliaceum]|uniref:DUF6598 domain-containing protein n=1 Tax=Panicum miliaceum TaxID=4540 RepID=A0A3L6Q3F6_PANMI|nr:hypothetical protein C2845_PM17G02470 [Panicum miliaceum]